MSAGLTPSLPNHASSAWEVLARKELRASLPAAAPALGFSLLLGLVAKVIGFDALLEAYYRELVLLLLLPLCGVGLGGAAVATERAEGTLQFLTARAASRRAILGTKLAWNGATLLLTWLAALLVVNLFPASASSSWLVFLQVPAHHAACSSLVLTVVLFLCAFGASLLLDDPITASLAGLMVGGLWIYAVIAFAMWAAGSLEVALGLNPWLGLGALGVPASLVAALVLGSRADASTSIPRVPLAGVCAGLALVVWLPVVVMPNDISHARDAREGRGRVEAQPLLPHASGTAVAFVITTTRGAETRQQAAITFMSKKQAASEVVVLPPGSLPVGWAERSSSLIVEWPGGVRKLVRLDGSIVETAGVPQLDPALAVNADLSVHDGRLVLNREGEDIQLYPPSSGVAP